jgi:FecR protein
MSNDHLAREQQAEVLEPLMELTRGSLGQMSPEQCLRGEAAIAERLAAGRPHRSRVALAAALVAAAAGLGGLLVAGAHWLKRDPARVARLSYWVEPVNSSAQPSGTIDSSVHLLRFSDGTEIRVEGGAQARVRSLSDHGATLAMSRGSLHADVVHSASSDWRFDAGPFTVHVTGTAFQLAWEPDEDRFDLRLEHGAVTVTSPVANDPIPLRGGQWLTIRPHSNFVFIRDLAAPNAAEPAPSSEAGAPEAQLSPVPGASDPPPRGPSPKPGHTWARDLARGKAEQIVAEAQRLGLDGCLTEASGSELAALADAARYTRRDEIARKAMLAERRRFAGSRRAVEAGLLLGRLAEAEHDDRQALGWFNTYLAEAPAGLYASEALGRKMAIVQRVNGEAAARAIAEDYLARYREGTYAAAARAILKSQ